MAELRIGVLGAANIARKVVIPSILRAEGVRLVAIGSESGRAADFVAEAGLDGVRVCRYEELLADPEVDAVYIPLPNHLHADWSKRAADAGKHVLCEKPAARTAAEAQEAIEHRTLAARARAGRRRRPPARRVPPLRGRDGVALSTVGRVAFTAIRAGEIAAKRRIKRGGVRWVSTTCSRNRSGHVRRS